MRAGEEARAGGLRGRDRKGFKRFLEKDGVRAESQVGGLTKFADEGFGGDLPCGGALNKAGMGRGGNEPAWGGREGGMVGKHQIRGGGWQGKGRKSFPGLSSRWGGRSENSGSA